MSWVPALLRTTSAVSCIQALASSMPHLRQHGVCQLLSTAAEMSSGASRACSPSVHEAARLPCSSPNSPDEPASQPRIKSAKRRAAEALLAARYSSGSLSLSLTLHPTYPTHLSSSESEASAFDSSGSCSGIQADVVSPGSHGLLSSTGRPSKAPRMSVHGSSRQPGSSRSFATQAAQHADNEDTQQQQGQAAVSGSDAAFPGSRPTVKRQAPQLRQQAQSHAQQQPVQNQGGVSHGQSISNSNQPPQQPPAQPPIKEWREVPSCPDSCSSRPLNWCHFPVALKDMGANGWKQVFEATSDSLKLKQLAIGYDLYTLEPGIQILYVGDAMYAEDALGRLKKSMKDSAIAIDLEWKPDRFAGQSNRVAVMQLASSHVCVVLHLARWRYVLPPAVRRFLADTSNHLVGYAWSGADEQKLQQSFKIGKADFGSFSDLQGVADALGYGSSPGLSRLTSVVMGFEFNKNRKVSMSNWAAPSLTTRQILYAALDVLSTGQVFRALRLWHSSPEACPGCKVPVGASVEVTLACESTGRVFTDYMAYKNSCDNRGMRARVHQCGECKRLVDTGRAAVPPQDPPPAAPPSPPAQDLESIILNANSAAAVKQA